MTILNYIMLGLSCLGFIFILLSIIFIVKEKRLENEKLGSGLNTIIFGLFFLMLLIVVNILKYLNEILQLSAVTNYIPFLMQIANLVFIPLSAICFLIAMVFFKNLV